MANPLKGKKIVLGITGSTAAYKACYVIRGLIKRGAEMQAVMTPAGEEFITPITLSALTNKPVISEFFAQRDGTWNGHVDLGLWADAILITPATVSTIDKMANSIADNTLITTYLSAKAPVFAAPAMDLDMYAHLSIQKNSEMLRSYGNHIIEPGTGESASHLVGKGRMRESEVIIRHLKEFSAAKEGELVGKGIVITAGSTYEKIDPVCFIGNYSSGKMGFALTGECAAREAEVILVSGPVQLHTHYPMYQYLRVESAGQILNAATSLFYNVDVTVTAIAVADYMPGQIADKKIKREETGDMSLNLKPTQDIAACLGEIKERYPGRILVGFALETNNEQYNAEDKLRRKNLDFIVLNSLNDKGAGFCCDTNKISIIDRSGKKDYPLESKAEVVADIIDHLVEAMDS